MKSLVLLLSLPAFIPPTSSEVAILLSHKPTKSPHSTEALFQSFLYQEHTKVYSAGLQPRLPCLCRCLTHLLLCSGLTVQNYDLALWVGSSSCTGVAALFYACCPRREIEVYIFTFLTLFVALLSPPLQQLK